MKKIGWKMAAILAAATMMAGCAQQPRFVWGNYENSLYAYYKNSDQRAAYEASLVKAIELGRKSGKIAPGLCAELGYLQLENGDLLEAQKNFSEEMTFFQSLARFYPASCNA